MNCLHKVKEKVVFIFVLFCFAKNVLFLCRMGTFINVLLRHFAKGGGWRGRGRLGVDGEGIFY